LSRRAEAARSILFLSAILGGIKARLQIENMFQITAIALILYAFFYRFMVAGGARAHMH
jgi:hypothetical protein